LHLLLGAFAGLIGIAYNRAILGGLAATERMHRWPVELRAAVIGVAVGLIAWLGPSLVGGGDPLTQRTLSGSEPVTWLVGVLLLRFALGPLCYAARTPGGLFAPMLVIGAQGGLLYGSLWSCWAAGVAPDPKAFAVVGMAAFFTAVVRSPLTGIVLVIELTGCLTLLLPMLAACFVAMLLPTLLREPPIYDSLRIDTVRLDDKRQ
jgi:CIC family chloride channel protein